MNRIERLARRFDRWQQRHRPLAFAVAVVKTQWCYRSTLSEANALKVSLPSIPNLQRIKAAQTRLTELDRQLDECARNDPAQKGK